MPKYSVFIRNFPFHVPINYLLLEEIALVTRT